jgi:transposase
MKRDISVVGIDIAKRVLHLVGMAERGKIVLRKRCSRGEVLPLMANLGPVTIGIEACGGAHYGARHLREQGHEVKLMAPQFVKPYVKSNKNDMRDAEAIAEAVTRPSMRFVPVKDIAQQDIPDSTALCGGAPTPFVIPYGQLTRLCATPEKESMPTFYA